MRIFALLALSACSVTPDLGVPGHPDPSLKPQLQFTVDSVKCDGTCIAPRQTLSKIVFLPPPKTHLLLINTCARQVEFWGPPDNKPFIYDYIPALFVETRGACPLLITAVTTIGELHRGIVDFSNVGAKNPAKVEVMCNGLWRNVSGFDFCSIASGLPVVIRSATPAVLARDPNSECPEPKGALREWQIDTEKPSAGKSGLCVYVLLNKAREEFRLTVNTYSSILGTFPKEKTK